MKQQTAYVAVEIENRTLTPVIELAGDAKRKTVPLTTIVDNQQRALVRLFLVRPDKTILLKEFDLTGLAPRPSGDTRFLLSCDYDGYVSLNVHLSVDGRPFGHAEIGLKRYLRDRRGIRIVTVGVLLLAAAVLALLLARGCGTPPPSQPPAESPTAQPAPPDPAPPSPDPSPDPAAPPPPQEAEDRIEHELVIYFRPDDPRLTPTSREQLLQFAREIAAWEEHYLTIRGHCALSGTEEGRVLLSRQRAENSAAFLVTEGQEYLSDPQITLEWYGAARLVTRDPERQHLNRRVEIIARGTR